MAKKSGFYEIRPGVFAAGKPGERATSVVQRDKETGQYRGVRGVRPLISEVAKAVTPNGKAMSVFERLAPAKKGE